MRDYDAGVTATGDADLISEIECYRELEKLSHLKLTSFWHFIAN